MNIEQLTRIVLDAAKILSAAYKTQGSIFSAIGLIAPLSDIRGANFAQAFTELKDLDAAEKASLESQFNAALDFGNDDVKAKVLTIEGFMDQALLLVQKGVAIGEQAVELEKEGLALLDQVRTFVGV